MNGIKRTKVIQSSSAVPADAAATYDLSNPLPPGDIRYVGYRIRGTATAQLNAGDLSGIFSRFKVSVNSQVIMDLQDSAAINTRNTLGRLGQMCVDAGGYISDAGSATGVDYTMWWPVGLPLTGSTNRIEVTASYIACAGTLTGVAEVWIEQGPIANTTIYAQSSSQILPADSQSQIVARTPRLNGAVALGAWVQTATADDSTFTDLAALAVGNFPMSAPMWRGVAGRNEKPYFYYDGATFTTTNGDDTGLIFVPLGGLTLESGAIDLLVTLSSSENVIVTPLLALPVSSAGEQQGRQTAVRAVGSAPAVTERVE